ncbi:MAG: hypothetical protein EBX96_04455, partial [Actinobacteria bacterium]|nr:hypothetical protein [Actinomycetota bacterium]
MSNQILTEIHVDLDNRDKNTALFRVFLAVPVLIFLSSFSEFADNLPGVIGGLLLELSNRINAYLLLLTDEYPSIEANQKVRLIYPEIEGGKKLSPWMPLIKWFLAIPLFLLGVIYAIYALALTLVAWITVISKGHYPEDKAEEVIKVIAYWNRL